MISKFNKYRERSREISHLLNKRKIERKKMISLKLYEESMEQRLLKMIFQEFFYLNHSAIKYLSYMSLTNSANNYFF